MKPILLTQVEKSFPAAGPVVRSLGLEIPFGQFVSFLGPSGCGKSTLLRLIAGLEGPDRGSIEGLAGRRLAFVFQEPLLLPWRTALENVRLPLELENANNEVSKTQGADEKARNALDRVGLSKATDKLPHELSGGMKMRVSLARALVVQPEVLLLDEPFSALDEVTRFELQEDLRALWSTSGMTVIFVTHSMSESAYLAQRQIVFAGPPAEIRVDRMSRLPSERDESIRLTSAFADEVRDLQIGFRSKGN